MEPKKEKVRITWHPGLFSPPPSPSVTRWDFSEFKTEAQVKGVIKESLDHLKGQCQIYTNTPTTFGYGESGHPDRLLLIAGHLYGLESKKNDHTSLLKECAPQSKSEPYQKKRLLEIINAGGTSVVIHKLNLSDWLGLLESISGVCFSTFKKDHQR